MRTAEKKIRKLKKSRLWPSIILFVFSLFLGAVLIAAEFCIYTSYVVESKYTQHWTEAQSLAQELDLRRGQDASLETAFSEAMQRMRENLQAAVVDSENNVLVSQGDVTADFSQCAAFEDADEIYLDQSSAGSLSLLMRRKMGKSQEEPLDSVDILTEMLYGKAQEKEEDFVKLFSEERKNFCMRMTYWNSVPMAEEGMHLIVKNELEVRGEDLLYGIGITAVSALMFLLILTAQFSNVVREVSSRRRIEKLLTIDNVTGGNNWIAFAHKTSRILSRGRNAKKTFAVVDLSVNKYQSICSLYGTATTEMMLNQVAETISGALTRKEVMGHVGSGSFAVLLNAGIGRQKTVERVEALLDTIRSGKTKKTDGNPVDCSRLNFKAGIYFVEPNKDGSSREMPDVNALYVNAGMAKASVAQEEGSRVACFSQKMLEDQLWEHRVENTMGIALQNEEFQVFIQPKYNPVSGSLEGGEALVRWMNPTDGMIAPGRFIPIFEKTGFVTKLDDYMISHVAKLQSGWLAQGKQIVPISVNISRAHFAQPDLAEHIRDLVDAYRVPHSCIEIELTESAFFDDKKALLSTVMKLQKYGFDVSMDDFGSGYSSLNSLKDLPLNVLKLDAEFFRGEDFDTRGEIVVGKAIALAKQLDMRIVAEGVEKKEQVDFLAEQGCDMIQGYYFAKPMPAGEYAQRLK